MSGYLAAFVETGWWELRHCVEPQISPTAAAALRPGFAEIMQIALVGLPAGLVLETGTLPQGGGMSAAGGSRALSICVFCGSAESPPQVFVDTARHLGEELGRRGHRLIYGGAPIGLMGVVARAVQASGGSGLHRRPVALINVSNFWRPFLQQTRRMAILGFTGAGGGVLFRVAELAGRGIDLVETEVTRASALPVARFGLSTRSS